MIDAIILAGGLGTRLRETVPQVPKPLAPINGVAFLDLLFQQIERSKVVDRIILAIGYRAEIIQEHVRQKKINIPLLYSTEEKPLGTGGAVQRAIGLVRSEKVFVFNGDSYLDGSLSEMARQYRGPCTIAYTHVADAGRFGRLELDKDQRVIAFREKESSRCPGYINAGIYLLEKKIFNRSLPEVFSLEKDLFSTILPEGIFGFSVSGSFIDIGTPESYLQAQTILKTLTR